MVIFTYYTKKNLFTIDACKKYKVDIDNQYNTDRHKNLVK